MQSSHQLTFVLEFLISTYTKARLGSFFMFIFSLSLHSHLSFQDKNISKFVVDARR